MNNLDRFLLAGGTVRGTFLNGTVMVQEMRAAHSLGILETLVLGHGYLGAGLLGATLKNRDRLSLVIDCSGPIKGMVVEVEAGGMVRGYLKQVPIPLDRELDSFDLSPFFGAGFLSVIRHLEGAKHPFEGRIMLEHGNIAQDLAHYCAVSEQIPTALNLSVRFARNGEATGAAGLLLQAMPGANQDLMTELENIVSKLPSLGQFVEERGTAKELLVGHFSHLAPEPLASSTVAFVCSCSRERLQRVLLSLPAKDRADLTENGPFPMEMLCHYCGKKYLFEQRDLKELFSEGIA